MFGFYAPMTRYSSWASVAFCAVVLLLTTGCAAEPEETAVAEEWPRSEPLVDDDVIAWADQLEADSSAGDVNLFEKIDLRAVLELASVSPAEARPLREEFIAGELAKAEAEQGLLYSLLKKIESEGSSYHFLHLQHVEGQTRALFRVFDAEGRLNYYSFALARRGREVKVVDIYTASAGECVSETVRRTFLPLVADANRDWLESVLGSSSAYVTHLKELVLYCMQVQNQEYAGALQTYENLPETLKHDKIVLQGRIAATQTLEDPTYNDALAAYTEHHANDPSLAWVLLDASLLREDYAAVLRAIDDLDRIVGGDPFLHTIRAHAHAALGDLATARVFLRRAIDEDPDMLEAYWTLLQHALKQQDHAETLHVLRALSTEFGAEFDDLRTFPEYANFVETPQYHAWLEFTTRGHRSESP